MGGRIFVIWLGVCLAAGSAAAQGHRGAPPGQLKKGAPPAAPVEASAPEVVVTTNDVRTFGSWLDDATLAPRRSVWLTTSGTRWSTPVAAGTDAPSFNVAAGLNDRLQVSLALSRSRAWFIDDSSDEVISGFGNVYAGIKYLLRDASDGIGFSVSPTLEVLNGASVADGSSRAGLVLPLSFEVAHNETRVYGSAGYYTRGATFASVAVERHLTPTVAVTGALIQSWSTAKEEESLALGLSRRRTDLAGGVTAFLSPQVGVFASVGRTVSAMEFDSARFVFTGGLAIGFRVPKGILPRPPR